jgi:predicted AlkP superfamily phosphohydrolase/phosphomutase
MRWFNRNKEKSSQRVVVIGLDCLAPELAFDEFANEMPTLTSLRKQGGWGLLESVIPPITVPAWACMTTGKHPGTLGIYGFRNRADYSYDKLNITTSFDVKEKAVWDYLSDVGKSSTLIGIPPGFPPKPFNGNAISCFLTPDTQGEFTHPASLKQEIQSLVGDYSFDVRNFRTDNKQWLLDQIYQLTAQRFRVASHLITQKPWDFFMMVDMGPDRLHHGFWRYFDREHIHHEPGNQFENSMREYYRYLDGQIKSFLELIPDDVHVLIVSDHGAKRMDGGICINEWLLKEGYLKLKSQPDGIHALDKLEVDWANTVAWGEGGYYSRIFLNVQGRESQGKISPDNYESIRDELIQKLESLGDEHGAPIGTRVYKPQDIYENVNGIAPDLIALFGDLHWRSVGTIGWNTVWVHENDTGPDDANHAQHGMFVAHNVPGLKGELQNLHLTQIAPTALELLGQPVPSDMEAKSML